MGAAGSVSANIPSNAAIAGLHAREVYDSRGNPTVEVELTTADGAVYVAIVPSGASTGIHEACELRDGGERCMGKGCLTAVSNVKNTIAPAITGMDVRDQKALDEAMLALDGTPNKTNLGANAILGVSLAAAKAGAAAKNIPLFQHFADLAGNTEPAYTLPTPCFNVINGGSHAGNKLAFQEYFIIPTGAQSFAEAMQIGTECYHNLKKIIKKKFGGDATLIGDEGGFAPPCDAREGVELVMEAISKAGYEGKCTVGMDVAASEFKVEGQDLYDLGMWYPEGEKDDPALKMTGAQLADFYAQLCADFPIVTIEDPFDQDDWESWTAFTEKVGGSTQVVGDDLTVTAVSRIETAVERKACNCLLLKVNQIGSVTESINAVRLAKESGWGVMCSHRSGETEDTSIADLAVGLATGQIKTGAPCRSDRLAKYNQLLRIEERLGAGTRALYPSGTPLFRAAPWTGVAAPAGTTPLPATKKATLVLMRHGESTWNLENKFTGWHDVPLTEAGEAEAAAAGTLLRDSGISFDMAFTSCLQRAQRTLQLASKSAGMDLPTAVAWRLNERHYGALQGLDKAETVEKHGKEQVQEWRRSYNVPPPAVDASSEYHPSNDPRYVHVPVEQLPTGESLEMTRARVLPYWNSTIKPVLASGRNVLVCAHGNSLRALLMELDGIGQDVIPGLNIPTATPLVYELDGSLKVIAGAGAVAPLSGTYLGDAEAVAARAAAVAAQTEKAPAAAEEAKGE